MYVNNGFIKIPNHGVKITTLKRWEGWIMDILLADGDRDFLSAYSTFLELSGHNVRSVFDGTQVMVELAKRNYDIVIVNINIPRIRCRNIVRHLNEKEIPSIVVTDRKVSTALLMDSVLAESYITLPFLPEELVSLISTVMKRHKEGLDFSCGDVRINEKRFTFGDSCRITNEELIILHSLLDNQDINISKASSYINALNNKFEKTSKNPSRITYVIGEGYRLVINK